MRKLVATLSILAGIFLGACIFGGKPPAPIPGGTIVLEAQSLPITKTLAWDESDTSVTDYPVTLDATQIGDPTVKQIAFTITTLGPHAFGIKACNIWGCSASAPFNVIVQLPTAVSNARIQ